MKTKSQPLTDAALKSFHNWLRGCLPGSASDVMRELQIGHKASPSMYAQLPKNALELTEALRAMVIRGLIENRGNEYFWKAEAAKAPQPQLF